MVWSFGRKPTNGDGPPAGSRPVLCYPGQEFKYPPCISYLPTNTTTKQKSPTHILELTALLVMTPIFGTEVQKGDNSG